MSEKLNTSGERTPEQLRIADRFRVNPEDYPILRKQVELSPVWGNNNEILWNIDKTVSKYVTSTASLISILDGTAVDDTIDEEKYGEKPDHVIYLDKSARPVSWLVGAFWDNFSQEQRPENSFLNIDRRHWFQRVLPEYNGELFTDTSGRTRRPDFGDFMRYADELPPEMFAKIRALYIEGGVETDDPEEIMRMPTKLDGKNIMIIDEVADTGATLRIAQYLLKRAIPEAGEIRGEYFWHQAPKVSTDGTLSQQTSVPVWYQEKDTRGRGIGEINQAFFERRHEEYQTPRTQAQKLGSFILSEYVDLDQEVGGKSRELAKEIIQMRDDYEAGKILLQMPAHWSEERDDARRAELQEMGVVFADMSDPWGPRPQDLNNPNTYTNIVKEIESRPPAYY